METIGRGPDSRKNRKTQRSKIHIVYGFLFGTALALVLGLVLGVGPFFSISAGICGCIAGTIIFRLLSAKSVSFDFTSIDGISKEMYEAAIADGSRKLSKLQASADRIQDRNVQITAKNICVLTEKILDNIKKDPKDVKPARSFLNYYLDTAMNILQQYNDIAVQAVSSEEVENVIKKVDRTLGTLEQAFEKQLAKLMENDVLALNTELTVLERTIEMEGFGKNLKNEGEIK
jgi:5-bromo-4-chloroindolyl phosphate hydrolysis protein